MIQGTSLSIFVNYSYRVQYSKCLFETDGRLLHLKVKSVSPKGPVIAVAQEVTDRNEAELMRGLELFIKRDALPPTANDEVYHTDLVGLEARDNDGVAIGVIVGLHDFGAVFARRGAILELRGTIFAPISLTGVPKTLKSYSIL